MVLVGRLTSFIYFDRSHSYCVVDVPQRRVQTTPPLRRKWLMGRERRRYRRVPVDWPAVVKHTQGGIVAEMENIGANGALIRCEKPLRPKERFMLHIMAPNHSTLSARAEVAWLQVQCDQKDIPPCGMGVRFTRASGSVRQFIKYFVAEHYEKRKPTVD